jgi:hypothetical protein
MEFDPPQVSPPPSPYLSDGWRTVAFITWVLAGASVLAIAITSRTIGRPLWWLGPESSPASPVFILIPLAIVVLPLVAASKKPEVLVPVGMGSSIALLITAVIDISGTPAVALAIGIVGIAALSVSIALLVIARQYR